MAEDQYSCLVNDRQLENLHCTMYGEASPMPTQVRTASEILYDTWGMTVSGRCNAIRLLIRGSRDKQAGSVLMVTHTAGLKAQLEESRNLEVLLLFDEEYIDTDREILAEFPKHCATIYLGP
jgi:hypothetical protein